MTFVLTFLWHILHKARIFWVVWLVTPLIEMTKEMQLVAKIKAKKDSLITFKYGLFILYKYVIKLGLSAVVCTEVERSAALLA